MHEPGHSWKHPRREFRYIPVLSAAAANNMWASHSGLVRRALTSDTTDLSEYAVYACDAPAMIGTARYKLSGHCNLTLDVFFADAFTFAFDSNM